MTVKWHCANCDEHGSTKVDILELKTNSQIMFFELIIKYIREKVHDKCPNAVIGVKV